MDMRSASSKSKLAVLPFYQRRSKITLIVIEFSPFTVTQQRHWKRGKKSTSDYWNAFKKAVGTAFMLYGILCVPTVNENDERC